MKDRILQLLEDKREILLKYKPSDTNDFCRLIQDEIADIDYDIEEFTTREINQQCCENKIAKLEKHIKNEWIIHHLGWVHFTSYLKKQTEINNFELSYHGRNYLICYNVNKYSDTYGVKGLEPNKSYYYKNIVEVLRLLEEMDVYKKVCLDNYNEAVKKYKPNMDSLTAIISWVELDRHGSPSRFKVMVEGLDEMPQLTRMVEDKDIKDVDILLVRGDRTLLIDAVGKITPNNFKPKLLKSISGYYENEFQREWLEEFINNL